MHAFAVRGYVLNGAM